MARTAAEMVNFYKEAIARKLDPDLGDGIESTGDAGGINLRNYSLEQLEAGLSKWERRVIDEASTTGNGLRLATITTIAPGSDDAAE